MNTFPPYEIAVYNRATEIMIGRYHSNQVPARGDQVSFFGHRIPGDPFELWGRWKVDEVVWLVSQAGSMNALELARTHNTHGQAACLRVEIHCWPAQGPFYENTPKWAKAVSPPGWRDDEPDADAPGGLGRGETDEQQPECAATGTCCAMCIHDLGECCKPGHVTQEADTSGETDEQAGDARG